MREITLKEGTLESYIKLVKTGLKELYNDEDARIYFRGESRDYGLNCCMPSIFRQESEEKSIYYKILRRYPEQFVNLTNLDILAKMQHYQVPTRLLDISTSPLVTLFFATDHSKENENEDSFVYVFKAPKDKILTFDSDKALLLSTLPKMSNVEKENIKKQIQRDNNKITPQYLGELRRYDVDVASSMDKFIYECERERSAFHNNFKVVPEDLSNPVYVKPQFYNPRMKFQSSLFVLFGISNNTMLNDMEFIREYIKENVMSIRIPYHMKKSLRADLKVIANISNESLFENIGNSDFHIKSEVFNQFKKNII